jgi:hypothetical protein
MNIQLSPKDWQLLSSYLDGQLAPAERSRLEQRLQNRLDLKTGLDELRRTRAMLRSVPKRKVPHNFTLTHAMVAEYNQPRFSRWFPALSFSSAAALVMLVLAVIFQNSMGAASLAALPAAAPMMQKSMAESSPSQGAAQDAATAPGAANAGESTPMILTWGGGNTANAAGVSGMGGAAPMAGAQKAAQPTPPPAPGIAAAPEATATTVGPAAEAPSTQGLAPTPTLVPLEPPATAVPDVAAQPLEGNGPILGVAPQSERGKAVVPTEIAQVPAEAQRAGDQQREAPTGFPWMIVEIGLGIITLGAGIGAFVLWRRGRRAGG